MELQFTKDAHGMWVSEFEVNSDFNLHIERTKGGIISLYQRTTGGGWDHVDAFEYVRHQASIDFDCSALVYPKWCKIESEVEPSYAAITTDGEVTEIKSQSKEVEIVANGVTEITPDAGFSYLNGVSVNVNVPQSGGSGGGGGSTIEYLDISGLGFERMDLIFDSCKIKLIYSNKTQITGGANLIILSSPENLESLIMSVNTIAIDLNSKICRGGDKIETVREHLLSFNTFTEEQLAAIPRITEEEFYTV